MCVCVCVEGERDEEREGKEDVLRLGGGVKGDTWRLQLLPPCYRGANNNVVVVFVFFVFF